MPKFAIIKTLAIIMALFSITSQICNPCYSQNQNQNCNAYDSDNIQAHTLHISVHPHLDAFWIFDFESYYNPSPTDGRVLGYFRNNRFNSVKQIFDETLKVLKQSKEFRQNGNFDSQRAHRSFFNSQMGFFKRWYFQQNQTSKAEVKQLLKTKYWEIVGGAFVQHDEGCAYYDDIIDNFQMGLHFLKDQFNYQPKAAVSADSFGHSQSTLAILAHIGIEGFFVERSDEHILKQNKTQFIWKAKSANGQYYGALPTHIRWAIHGFEDQFIPGGSNQEMICKTKDRYIKNMQQQNQFLKKILKSSHIMRYFGHDFQKFDDHSYYVMEGIMEQFSRQKCRKVSAVYGNPTEYFKTLMGQVFNKVKPVATREEDIMPIWDYDSGLYWTGYYTTDPFHKKNYRNVGRYLHLIRKAFLPSYIQNPNSPANIVAYKKLEQLAQINAYLQHHDGISGTSKYEIMDEYQKLAQTKIVQIKNTIQRQLFQVEYPEQINHKIFECSLQNQCTVPETAKGDIYLKIFNSGGKVSHSPIIVHLQENQYYQPECDYYQINCLCTSFPCPCSLYLFTKVTPYTLIRLKKVDNRPKDANLIRQISESAQTEFYNKTHLTFLYQSHNYSIGYKTLNGDPTPRHYKHLTRYGTEGQRSFTIRSGKYALGNDISTEKSLSTIRKVYKLQSDYLKKFIIIWARQQMKTIITMTNSKMNEWKVQTISAAQAGKLEDIYLEISAPHISNNKVFYTDSNGWLVMKRQLFKHEDYQAFFSSEKFDDIDGNSYPMTAFCFIQDINNPSSKLSVNTDRPQGVISYRQGTIWINYDRLSADDGKWVYQTTLRNQYQKFTHVITVNNQDNNQRNIQQRYDQPLLIQGFETSTNLKIDNEQSQNQKGSAKWVNLAGIQNVKFLIKAWNDSSTILRVQNMHDNKQQQITLYTNNKISPFLTAFYGNVIQYESIQQTSLGGNMPYSQFIEKKWNWNKVVSLQKQNKIFDKVLTQKITLRPLEIRSFTFKGLKIGECKNTDELKYSNSRTQYKINTQKQMPLRTQAQKINEDRINKYLINGDHCNDQSPVLKNGSTLIMNDALQASKGSQNPAATNKNINILVVNDAIQKVSQDTSLTATSTETLTTTSTSTATATATTTTTATPTPTPTPTPTLTPEQITENNKLRIESLRTRINNGILLTRQQKQTYFIGFMQIFVEKEVKKDKSP